jgi:hypothetical protein
MQNIYFNLEVSIIMLNFVFEKVYWSSKTVFGLSSHGEDFFEKFIEDRYRELSTVAVNEAHNLG